MRPPSEQRLQEWLALRGGDAPFEDFMQAALYDPEFGYYTRTIRTVGRTGDFSTTPTLHFPLGEAIARWAFTNGQRNVIELGGGDGSLAHAVLKSLHGGMRSLFGRKFRYHIVDISAPLIAKQQAKLAGFSKHIQWHSRIEPALAAAEGKASIFSNELADAFPASVFRFRSGTWEKLWLTGFRAVGRLPESSAFSPNNDWPDGQIVEVLTSYEKWLESWQSQFRSGHLLTIDYGDTCPAIYHRRPRGSLRAYCHHQRLESLEEITARFGLQDITTDVNFTDLQAWGEDRGLITRLLTKQSAFAGDPAVPEAFKVLWQVRSKG